MLNSRWKHQRIFGEDFDDPSGWPEADQGQDNRKEELTMEFTGAQEATIDTIAAMIPGVFAVTPRGTVSYNGKAIFTGASAVAVVAFCSGFLAGWKASGGIRNG